MLERRVRRSVLPRLSRFTGPSPWLSLTEASACPIFPSTDCLRLTKAMQGAAETLLEVAEEEEKHVSSACFNLLLLF